MNHRFVIVGVLAMLLAFVAPVAGPQMLVSSAAAQASGIVIEGNQRVENDTIIAYLQFDSASGYDARLGRRVGQGPVSDGPVHRRADHSGAAIRW